jgi:hypothetical protein
LSCCLRIYSLAQCKSTDTDTRGGALQVRCMSTDTDKSTDTDTRGGALQVRCMRKGHGALECPVCLQVLSLLALLVHEYRYVSSGTKFARLTSTRVQIRVFRY